MANVLIPFCSVTVSTAHLLNHTSSLISLLIPLFTCVCSPIHYMCTILYELFTVYANYVYIWSYYVRFVTF